MPAKVTVTAAATEADLDELHAWAASTADPAWLCSVAAPPHPSRATLSRYLADPSVEILVARQGSACCGFAVMDRDGRVLWLRFDTTNRAVAASLLRFAQSTYPTVWGTVHNARVRQALLSAGCVDYPQGGPDAIAWKATP